MKVKYIYILKQRINQENFTAKIITAVKTYVPPDCIYQSTHYIEVFLVFIWRKHFYRKYILPFVSYSLKVR